MFGTVLKSIAITPVILLFLLCNSAFSSQNDGSIGEVIGEVFAEETVDKASDIFNSLDIGKEDKQGILKTVEWMVSSDLKAEAVLEYLSQASVLSGAGISTKDISHKIREGIAKGISQERIIAVLKDRVQRLKDARVLALTLENEGVGFLDRQMSYRILADYLSRGIPSDKIMSKALKRDFEDYQALESVVE